MQLKLRLFQNLVKSIGKINKAQWWLSQQPSFLCGSCKSVCHVCKNQGIMPHSDGSKPPEGNTHTLSIRARRLCEENVP